MECNAVYVRLSKLPSTTKTLLFRNWQEEKQVSLPLTQLNNCYGKVVGEKDNKYIVTCTLPELGSTRIVFDKMYLTKVEHSVYLQQEYPKGTEVCIHGLSNKKLKKGKGKVYNNCYGVVQDWEEKYLIVKANGQRFRVKEKEITKNSKKSQEITVLQYRTKALAWKQGVSVLITGTGGTTNICYQMFMQIVSFLDPKSLNCMVASSWIKQLSALHGEVHPWDNAIGAIAPTDRIAQRITSLYFAKQRKTLLYYQCRWNGLIRGECKHLNDAVQKINASWVKHRLHHRHLALSTMPARKQEYQTNLSLGRYALHQLVRLFDAYLYPSGATWDRVVRWQENPNAALMEAVFVDHSPLYLFLTRRWEKQQHVIRGLQSFLQHPLLNVNNCYLALKNKTVRQEGLLHRLLSVWKEKKVIIQQQIAIVETLVQDPRFQINATQKIVRMFLHDVVTRLSTDGMSLLFLAVLHNMPHIVAVLLKNQASTACTVSCKLQGKDQYGYNILHWTVLLNPKIVTIIHEHVSSEEWKRLIQERTKDGKHVLDILFEISDMYWIDQYSLQAVPCLLEGIAHADPPLLFAPTHDKYSFQGGNMMHWLAQMNVEKINVPPSLWSHYNIHGNAPIHTRYIYQWANYIHQKAFAYVLHQTPQKNIQSTNGDNVLHRCAAYNQSRMTNTVFKNVERSVFVTMLEQENKDGLTPMSMATNIVWFRKVRTLLPDWHADKKTAEELREYFKKK
tara:strand:+ start:801 stop:2996 length:2196 start_codon:yes stop_codon:yes gene_type:complete